MFPLIAQFIPGLDLSQLLLWAVILTPIVLLLTLGVTSFIAIDVAKTIVTTIGNIFQQILKVVTPPKPDSWQTLIWISAYSWLMSLMFRTQWMQALVASIGWLFLIPGVHWFMHVEKLEVAPDKPVNVKKGLSPSNFYIAPWITGALICMFLFGGLADGMVQVGLVTWPIISAIIAVLPRFIQFGPTYKVPEKPDDRQWVILVLLSNLVLACWLHFCFFTQAWLRDYPSLTANDVSRSSFVVKLDPNQSTPRGVYILNQAANLIKQELDGRSWSWIERWLFNLDQQIDSIEEIIMNQISKIEENKLWDLKARVAVGTEYNVRLFAIWRGPTVDGKGYYLTKDCYITKVSGTRVPLEQNPGDQTKTGLGLVQCAEVQGPFSGQPNLDQVRIAPNYDRGQGSDGSQNGDRERGSSRGRW